MNTRKNDPSLSDTKFEQLRRRAIELLKQRENKSGIEFEQSYERIVQELDIYHAELELQQRELLESQQRLEESRNQYFDLFNAAPVGFVVLDQDGIITEANLEVSRMLAKSVSRIVGKTLSSYVDPDDLDQFVRFRQSALQSAEPRVCQVRLQSTGGSPVHVQMNSISMIPDQRRQGAMMVSLTDITALKNTEAKLRQARWRLGEQYQTTEVRREEAAAAIEKAVTAGAIGEHQFRTLIDNTSEGIVIVQDARIRFVNARMAEMVGKSREELDGGKVVDFIYDEDRDLAGKLQADAMSDASSVMSGDLRVKHNNGATTWVRDSILQIEWRGRPATLNFLLDITERKKYEIQLADQKNLLQKVLDNIPAMICVFDDQFRLTLANADLRRRLGWTAEELNDFGDLMAELYPDPAVRKEVESFMQNPIPEVWRDFLLRTRSGETIETTWSNVRLDDNYTIGIGIDISVRKRYERDLEEAKKKLEVERDSVKNKNVALEELLNQIKLQREDVKRSILINIEETVLPVLVRLKGLADDYMRRNLELVEGELRNIASPLVTRLRHEYSSLTPRQVSICKMIKSGMSTKEIADTLGVSEATAQKHREMIRKKFGLTGAKTTLVEFLRSFDID